MNWSVINRGKTDSQYFVPASDFMNGFHGYTTRNGQPLLWMRNLGTPVTYGCILLSTENAALLYDWADEGVIVEITP